MEMFDDTNGQVFNWVVSNLDDGELYINDLTIGIKKDNILIAGIIYSNVEEDCFLSIFANNPKWCTKKNLSILFDIPFKIFNKKEVKCSTSIDNKRIQKLLTGLGFRKEIIENARANGSHLVLYKITKDELNKKEWFKWAE